METNNPSVLITGGTRGIGLALAKNFLQKGWSVSVSYHQDEADAQQAQTELSSISPQFTITKSDIIVYPNPASSVINLAIPQSNSPVSYNIQIVNNMGAIIKTSASSQPSWQGDVSQLLPGTYIIRVLNTNDKSIVGKSTFVKL